MAALIATESVEERGIDPNSACQCSLLLTASAACCCCILLLLLLLLLLAAAGRSCCLHDFYPAYKCLLDVFLNPELTPGTIQRLVVSACAYTVSSSNNYYIPDRNP